MGFAHRGPCSASPLRDLPTLWWGVAREPVAPHALTDRVRQALAANRVDPIPPFAATVVEHRDSSKRVGVVRMYESADTPHVMGNGQVFIRSVAEDRDLGRRYRAGGVETQTALLELADRGRRGVDVARARLDPNQAPFAASLIGISSSGVAVHAPDALVGLRAIPVTRGRFADWAVSEPALAALGQAARTLARRDGDQPLEQTLNASGLAVRARSEDFLGGEVQPPRDGVALAATDQAGLAVAGMQLSVWQPARPPTRLTLNGLRDFIFRPVLEAAISVLEAAEAYGRVLLELRVGRLEAVIELDDEGGSKNIPSNLPLGHEIALPLSPERDEIRDVADRWRSDAGRAAGYFTLRS